MKQKEIVLYYMQQVSEICSRICEKYSDNNEFWHIFKQFMCAEKIQRSDGEYLRITVPIYVFPKKNRFPDFHNCCYHLLVIKCPWSKGGLRDFYDIFPELAGNTMKDYQDLNGKNTPCQFCVIRMDTDFGYRILASSSENKFQMPPRQTLKQFCRRIHSCFLVDLLQVFEPIADKNSTDAALSHIGWINHTKHAVHTAAVWRERLCAASNIMQRFNTEDCPIFLRHQTQYFEKQPRLPGPAAIMIPLLAYTAFSILKPFFRYPYRMSKEMAYDKAGIALHNSFAVSLTREYAAQYARFFCGIFQEYPSGNIPEDARQKKASERAIRVHDGIVIYHHAHGWDQEERNHARLQDACILAVDAEYPDDPNFLHLQMPDGAREPEHNFDPMLLLTFLRLISNATTKLWEIDSHKRKGKIKVSDEAKRKKEHKELEKSHPYLCNQPPKIKGIIQEEETRIEPLVDYRKAYKAIRAKPGLQQDKVRWCAYLLASYEALLRYEDINPPDENEMSTKCHQACVIFQEICSDKRSQASLRTFSEYISAYFTAGEIIMVRGEANPLRPCKGWYDHKKCCVYFPYAQYYDDFSVYCDSRGAVAPEKTISKRCIGEGRHHS